MLPLQCPLVSSISHSTALSPEPAITALSTLGDALEWTSNRVLGWAQVAVADEGSADADADALRTANLCLAVGAAAAIAGVWNLGRFLWQGRQMALAREALAEREQMPQRIVQRRNAIDEVPPGAPPDAEAVVFWLEFGHAPPPSIERQHSPLSQRQRDGIFNRGSQDGYAAESGGTDGAHSRDVPSGADGVPLPQRFAGEALKEALRCYDDGHKVGAEAARQWQLTEERA